MAGALCYNAAATISQIHHRRAALSLSPPVQCYLLQMGETQENHCSPTTTGEQRDVHHRHHLEHQQEQKKTMADNDSST